MKIGVLDPKSMEFVRGGLCFSPYLTYSFLKAKGEDVEMFEDWPMSRLEVLPKKDAWIIGLWSYPQIESCRFYDVYLPGKKYYEGYVPLIESLGLPVWEGTDYREACYWFNMYLDEFEGLDPYDMDAHVVGYYGRVVPMLLSYGCDYRCAFCPGAKNRPENRLSLSEDQVKEVLAVAAEREMTIHFHDEDLFQDLEMSVFILEKLAKYDVRWLCLSTVKGLADVVREVGVKALNDSGYILAELGLETVDVDLQRRMHKHHREDDLAYLVSHDDLCKFWLTITFHPGETLETLRATGEFLRLYGFQPGELLPRIATNSCEGGLGQFFQPYIGTPGYGELEKQGRFLTDTFHRLVPSFLPHSLLNEVPQVYSAIDDGAEYYLGLYGVDGKEVLERIDGSRTVGDLVAGPEAMMAKRAIAIAVLARLGVIGRA